VALIGLDNKLGEEVVKSRGLERELAEVKDTLQKESDKHDSLCVTVPLICDNLESPQCKRQTCSQFAPFGLRIRLMRSQGTCFASTFIGRS
jgi:hypothetical protein